jgi:hypothetical protein
MCGDSGAEPSLVQAKRLNAGEGAVETEAEALQQLVLHGCKSFYSVGENWIIQWAVKRAREERK